MLDFEGWVGWDEFCDRPSQSDIIAHVAEKKKDFKRRHDNGEPRPHCKSKEGIDLIRYTSPSSQSCQPGFREELPRWFNKIAKKKKDFKRRHDNGEPRPHWSTIEGKSISSYISPSSGCFDSEFRESVPRWIEQSSVAEKKKELKRKHDNGEPKPHHKSTEGRAINRYTCLSSPSYDSKFRDTLPKWFVDSVAEKKKELKRKHDNGEPKPHCKSTEGKIVTKHISPHPELREEFSKWFVDSVAEKKKELKRKHDNGEPRPHRKSTEGQTLKRYTIPSSGCFDSEFRESVPRWFKQSAVATPEELKRKHDNGEPKPHHKSTEGRAINRYTCPSSPSYDSKFRKSVPRWFKQKSLKVKPSEKKVKPSEKKKELKRKHDNGEPKPHHKSTEGRAISRYTCPSSRSYDSKFRDTLPKWFVDSVAEKKKELKRKHDNGEPRPHRKSTEGQDLSRYTTPSSQSYDSKFRDTLPKWLKQSSAEKKQQFLEMARNGEDKPYWKTHPEFHWYVNPNSGSYDGGFVKQIKKLAPKWFVKSSDQKKQQLLKLAWDGKKRPPQGKHPLGALLCRYTNTYTTVYDAEFTKQIKKLRPDWFVSPSVALKRKKQQLLEMARNGKDKPPHSHSLYQGFVNYTNSNSKAYDAEFTKQIKKLRPDWFIAKSKRKKQQLLKMARDGENKPSKTCPLGKALYTYTRVSGNSYDPDFTKQIKKLTPKWFVKKQPNG